jgi:murein DD-endopeptidase MepM/ murein hydrolase activator NlpD
VLRVLVRVVAVVPVVVIGTPIAVPPPAGAATAWVRPVPGPIVRPFVAPASPYGPGHRGVDLRADPGEPVRAVAAGVVERAGPVGGALHVVLRLRDGARATCSYLASVGVRAGDRVAAGAVLGTAGGRGVGHPPGAVHLSWRVGDRYRDPARRLAPRGYRLLGTPTGRPSGGLG